MRTEASTKVLRSVFCQRKVGLVMTNHWITLCFVISISRLIVAANNYDGVSGFKPPLNNAIDNTTAADLESKSVAVSRETNARALNTFTKYSVQARSLTQELYGVATLPGGDTKSTFQEIFDEFVVSYFASRVDSKLVLDSKITVTNVLLRPNGKRNLQAQTRNLDVSFETPGRDDKGSSVIITFDQQLSYFFPQDGKNFPLETLVTLPFITEIGRDEFISKLKDSGDTILRDVIGVSGVDLPSQPSIPAPINLPTQEPPGEPGSEPQPSQSTNSAPGTSPKSPVPTPSKRPTPAPIPTAPPIPPPSQPPVQPPTARPTSMTTKSNPLQQNNSSGGISGLLVIGCLMLLLFIIFMINMKFCMGEYVD